MRKPIFWVSKSKLEKTGGLSPPRDLKLGLHFDHGPTQENVLHEVGTLDIGFFDFGHELWAFLGFTVPKF